MTTYIALLRAVNLGPHNKIGMSDLRELLTSLGMQGVQTLLQSGNAVFQSDARTTAPLERLIEGAAAKQLHVETDVMIRSHTGMEGHHCQQSVSQGGHAGPESPPRPAAQGVARPRSGRRPSGRDRRTRGGSRRWPLRLHRLPGWHRPFEADERADREETRHTRYGSQLEHGAETRCAR